MRIRTTIRTTLCVPRVDTAVAADEAKLADVTRVAGRWKRLGERLHPRVPEPVARRPSPRRRPR